MECNICFCDAGKAVLCYDTHCTSRICHDCITPYMNFCSGENTLPKCVAPNCGKIISYGNVKSIPKLGEIYGNILVKYFAIMFEERTKIVQGTTLYIEKYRKDREEYMNNLPLCISLVANITLTGKISKLETQFKKKVGLRGKKTFRNCAELYCKGILDETYTCVKCGIEQCENCGEKKEKGHECKKEDIESKEFVDNLISCPKCGVKILKSWGCDLMTCSHCRTNFHYNTGKLTLMGNHANDVHIELKDESLPHRLGKKYPDMMPKFVRIEMYRPEHPQPVTFKMFEQNKTNTRVLCAAYDKYMIGIYKTRKYTKILKSIDDMSDNGELTIESLNKLIAEICV